jgi:hypothetical protein
MKTITLNKGSIDLPENWEDLTFKQKLVAFEKLKDVIDRKLDPKIFRLEILKLLTGYKPGSDLFSYLFKLLIYYLIVPFCALYFRVRYGNVRSRGYWSIWKYYHRPKRHDRDMITFNLYRLSEQLTFAFDLEKNPDGSETICIKKEFVRNPVPYLKIQGLKFTGRKFIKDIAPFTNITPKEFSDCFDLYVAYNQTEDKEIRNRCLDKIISILYPMKSDYKENMVSNHVELISTLSPGLKLGIYLWFSGIVEYYISHPIYSILFRSEKDSETEKITLGMDSSILMAERKGYDLSRKDLNDFFNIQIKVLQDDLNQAIAYGATPEELSQRTGISLNDINKLI